MNRTEQLLIVGLIAIGSVAIAWLNDLTKPKKAKKPDIARPNARGKQLSPAWCMVLMVAFAVIFWFLAPRHAPPPGAAQEKGIGGFVCLGVFVVTLAVVVAKIAIRYLRYHDAAVNAALRRANAGDIDGAVADLQRAIEKKGMTVNRANGLGTLLSLQGKWDEALAAFREAERRGGAKRGIVQYNIGVSLAKLRRGDEAHPYLMKGVELEPNQIGIGLYVCRTLAELGYWDDAREVFRRTEAAHAHSKYLLSSHRKQVEAEFESCRMLLAGKAPRSADDLLDEF